MLKPVDLYYLKPEIQYQTSRSSGAGGQHVNKVNSRVELRFSIRDSGFLKEEQKELLIRKLASRLTDDGELIIVSEATRSQHQNKEDCNKRFFVLISNALKPDKKRIATMPSLNSRKKRLESKKKNAGKKQQRRKPDL